MAKSMDCSCEGCGKELMVGDLYSWDRESAIYFCEECTPTWQDMQDDPASYYHGEDEHGEPIYLTAETVIPVIKRHLANGGKMTDKLGLRAD